jgi:hypothetical protein
MLVIRNNNNYDYVDDLMIDNLIKSKEIVKFKRGAGWVTVGAEHIQGDKRYRMFNGNDKLAINDSIFVREYRRAYR